MQKKKEPNGPLFYSRCPGHLPFGRDGSSSFLKLYIDSSEQINIPYSIEFLADLDRTISRARLSRYMTASGGNVDQTLQLYEKNVLLSEALFGFLHGLEISTHNSLNVAFSDDLGVEDWCHDGQPLPWSLPTAQTLNMTIGMKNMVAAARSNAGPNATVGKVIAELPFGYWTLLMGNRFDDIWRRSLYKAFPHARVRRQIIHWRLDTVRFLRNRIAHQEPILSSSNRVYTGHLNQLTMSLPEMLECVFWISPATADCLRTSTRYETAKTILLEVSNSGVRL